MSNDIAGIEKHLVREIDRLSSLRKHAGLDAVGTRLIKRNLAAEFKGAAELEYQPMGSNARSRFGLTES